MDMTEPSTVAEAQLRVQPEHHFVQPIADGRSSTRPATRRLQRSAAEAASLLDTSVASVLFPELFAEFGLPPC
jgi:hypothetical protein